jgi:hypothetical protein
MIGEGIRKFILIGENVLNFHSSDNLYYEEWRDDVADDGGWIVMIDLPEHSQYDFKKARVHHYVELIDYPVWRTVLPQHLFAAIDNKMLRRLNNA